jgi:hypothetical protein
VQAGIPLVASIAVEPGELDGFRLPQGTSGHLVVIVGLTPEGNVIVNDPAADSNDTVRRVYDRAQFEGVWVRGWRRSRLRDRPSRCGLAAVPGEPVTRRATFGVATG